MKWTSRRLLADLLDFSQRAFRKLTFPLSANSSEIVSLQRRLMQKRRIRYTHRYRKSYFSTLFIGVLQCCPQHRKTSTQLRIKKREYFDSCMAFVARRLRILERQWHFLHEMKATATLWNRSSTKVLLEHAAFLYRTGRFQHGCIKRAHTRRKHALMQICLDVVWNF